METTQKRIFLWTCPRSLSTAFYRAITNAPATLGVMEPYSDVIGYTVGNKTGPRTLEGIIEKLNQPFPDYSTIFVKDMAYCLVNKIVKIEDVLPDGYIHTFLIRDPRKSIPSLYKMFTCQEGHDFGSFDSRQAGFKGLYEMYTYLTTKLGLKCLVIDADDLQNNPESVLTTYCEFVGIDFHPSMCNWNLAEPSKLETFKAATNDFHNAWYKTAKATSTFMKTNGVLDFNLASQPIIVQETITENMPYYELMYAKRALIN